MIDEKLLDLLAEADIFFCVKKETLGILLNEDNISLVTFKSGEVVFSSETNREAVGIVVSGNAKVLKKDSDVLVGRLFEKDIFGCQSLFLGASFFTNEIVSSAEMQVLFVSKSAVVSLMQSEPNFSLEYIRYLSGRIYYLGNKIKNFTGGTAESRLASYLLGSFGDYKTFCFDMPFNQFAVFLDIGRASLYRAFDSLSEAHAIEKKGKTVRLLNKDALLSFVK